MKSYRRAFTLIELLTVLAITAILMTFIVVPVVQSFNMLRAGQGWSDAQERARVLSERIAAEMANSAGVRDNSGVQGSLGVVVPGENGAPVEVMLPYTKVDIVKPSEGEPERGPSGAYINPRTGKEDPTLLTPKGQVTLPAAPGASYVRYFVGLRQPTRMQGNAEVANPYNNPWEPVLMTFNPNRDNLYVLFRVEYVPFVFSNGQFRVNTSLFQDANSDNVPDDFDDPYFFTLRPTIDYNPANNALTPAGQAKAQRIRNWLRRAVIQTDVSRYDMIQPVIDIGNPLPYNGVNESPVVRENNVPKLMPLVQFRPTRITSEPAEAFAAVRQGEETEGMEVLAPDVFRTKYGAWTNSIVRTWPSGWNVSDPNQNSYLVGRTDATSNNDFKIFYFDPDSMNELTGGLDLFNVSTYRSVIAQGTRYPFSAALNLANLTSQPARDRFVPYYLDYKAGKLVASFPISEMGNVAITPPADNPNNLPARDTGPEIPAVSDTATSGNFYDPAYSSINKNFNWVWNNRPELRPNIHRFIDLRVTPQPDGTLSPLHPDPATGYPRARIVPNSEEVYGPDQNPGPNYGNRTRYTRTTRQPGPNQYRINYVNLAEPDYSALGLPPPPASYNPQDFMSAIYQPRYKAGYIQLNSDPNVALPADNPATTAINEGQIQVYYKFQMTTPGDVIAVDYDTRQLMTVLLTVRNYPQTTLPNPQTITLRASAKVRNFLR